MLDSKEDLTAGHNSPASTGQLLRMYYYMVLMREFEESINRLYQQGKIVGGAYSGRGNEATAVGTAFALRQSDYLFPLHRDLGAHFVKGQSVRALMLQQLGRSAGPTHGRDGTGHYSDPRLRIFGNISHLGAMIPVACGVALASQLKKADDVALTYIGDGGASVGEVHEGLVMASAMRLPFILIIENNQFAYSTPVQKQFAGHKLSDRAIGYGIPGVTIDGTNVLEVYKVTSQAVHRARNGEGPTIIESVTMRLSGHAAHDTSWYVDKSTLREWEKKDPIRQFEQFLFGKNLLDESAKNAVHEEIRGTIQMEVEFALSQPYPSGQDSDSGIYAG